MARAAEACDALKRYAALALLALTASACSSASPDDLDGIAGSGDADTGGDADTALMLPLWPTDHPHNRHLEFGYADPALAGIVGSALSRWARATCLPLSIASQPDHFILMDDDRLIPDGREGQTTGRSWEGTTVVLREGLPTELAAVLLAHEVCHILAQTNGHTYTGVCRAKVSRTTLIDDASLEEVCAARDCGCFRPEEPPPG